MNEAAKVEGSSRKSEQGGAFKAAVGISRGKPANKGKIKASVINHTVSTVNLCLLDGRQ
jgi:hypothetical protein